MRSTCLRSSATVLLLALCTPILSGAERVSQDLCALYDFEERSGTTVHDQSSVDPPIHLEIEKPSATRWRSGALIVHSPVLITATAVSEKISGPILQSGALTIEAWVKPQNAEQAGPARIVSLSQDPTQRNFTLGQEGRRYEIRLRTTTTDNNGIPSTSSPDGSVTGDLTHIVYTRDAGGVSRVYINGAQTATGNVGGALSNWSHEYRLALSNERTQDRAWLGELHLVAIYSRALSDAEVAQNFAAGTQNGKDILALLPMPAVQQIDFVTQVQPIFREHCFECHAEGNEEGGLNLGVQARVMEGGKTGPALIRGDSGASRLIHLVAAVEENLVMPPEGDRLNNGQIGILRAWIDQGAKWPAGADVLDPRLEKARTYWAFQPLRSAEIPRVKDESWARTPIDRFLLAGLEAKDLRPSPRISAQKLIRRMAFDITGLPPTPDEVDRFCEAAGTDWDSAVQSLVDRLLQTHSYGERWGRHWLDVARYADSGGQEGDYDRPHAYHYRDFVITALNDDMSFDAFVRWQLAGDEYEPNNPAAVAATGFLVAGPNTVLEDTFLEEERLRNRYNELDDMLSTIGTGILGLTIGCARCHDHKYDAISSREYYRLLSCIHSGDRKEVKLESGEELFAFRDFGAQPRPTWLFQRADFRDRDQMVHLGFLDVLSRGKSAEEYWSEARQEVPPRETTYQRRALADWITDVEHGAGALVARVIVNRVWRHHFGEGLVRTVSDFGVRSDPPTHPELLDWLADDFVAHGWKLKRLHQMILASAAYQQATKFDAASAKVDPENRLLWRMRPRRLEAEILRDSILAVSGVLNTQVYGPAFKPPISEEAMVARNLKSPYQSDSADDAGLRRRTIYMFHKRVIPYPLMQAFDRPDSLQSCGRRESTTVAPQALALLNDPFVRARSLDFADQLLAEHAEDHATLVEKSFRIALGRKPSDTEKQSSLEFIASQTEQRQKRDASKSPEEIRRLSVADYCQSIFGLNEFIYVD